MKKKNCSARRLAVALLIVYAIPLAAQTALLITTTTLPDALTGSPYSQTLIATGGTFPYSWTVVSGSLPPGLTLASSGVIAGTPTSAGTFSFIVRVTDSSTTPQTASQLLTLIVGQQLVISTASLPNGVVDVPYLTQTMTATGGRPPYAWTIPSGLLPPGLTLSTDGTIGGTPAVSGTFVFAILVSDSGSQTASKTFAITIQPKLNITSSSPLPTAIAGVSYSQQLTASGPSSVTWSVVSGNVPAGLSLSSSGNLSGTPTTAGTFDVTIQASGDGQTARQTFRLVVTPTLTITTQATLPDALLAGPYSVTLAAAGGTPPYTWSTSGRLPAGLTLSSSGVISGTPTGLGTFSVPVDVNDNSTPRLQTTRTFSITVASILTITTATLPNAYKDIAYSQQLQATGGTAPYTWLVTSGSLPAGLTLTTGGLLQGTPTAAESQDITITVTDSRGVVSTTNFSVVVTPQLAALSAPGLPATSNPTQQFPLSVALAEPHPSALSGRLTLTFLSRAEVPADDPMTQFSTGSRTVNFTIPANSTAAVFTPPVMLLTGTVAGTVRLRAAIQDGPTDLAVTTMDILALPPQITHAQAVRTANGIDLLLTGYSSARRVTSMEFNFEVKTGSKIQHATLSRNVDPLFAGWYQSPASVAYGSAFSFTQSFTIQGSGSTIESVTVTLKNAQGNTTTALIRPQ